MAILPDVLSPGLAIVFCGTAVGAASARRHAYYAGPGNVFWPTLARVALTPHELRPEEYPGVTRYGLGLTDLAKTVSGSDSVLRTADFDSEGLRRKLLRFRPQVLAFTSKRAAQEFTGHAVDYGLQRETLRGTALFVLPSPSGAARRWWSEAPWFELARLRSA